MLADHYEVTRLDRIVQQPGTRRTDRRAQKVLILLGTRPEVVKMTTVVDALRSLPQHFDVSVGVTAQHRDLLDQMLRRFSLVPDFDLDLMHPDQTPNEVASRVLVALDKILVREQPDWMLVQGDTTTAMVGTLAAFHRQIRVGHVEAGLRTGDLQRPFPEEANRRIIDVLADAMFAPTPFSAAKLLAEGIPREKVFVTGNTVVDALSRLVPPGVPEGRKDQVLITIHRRESFGEPLREVLGALRDLAETFPAIRWVYPVHPNPNVLEPVQRILGTVDNIDLPPPMDYDGFVAQIRSSRLILTDSGGVQEEAPSFGTPVLVLRDKTERPEGVWAGAARLLGTDRGRIVRETSRLLTDPVAYSEMAQVRNPYGDGRASERIAAILRGAPWEPFHPEESPSSAAEMDPK